jgi:hypothetical protein
MTAFAALSIALVAALGWVLSLVFRTAADQRAILTSAVIAVIVQIITFGIVRLSAEKNVIAGWGLGAVLRFLVLGVYALVIVRAFALPTAAALVSLASFLFASTLVEPLLLKL